MPQLSQTGQQAVNDLAARHGFSPDAVATMLAAMVAGNGGMAQFNHPEFGGSGQWMRGGMSMIGDMFNNMLKGRVDALCADLSALVANEPGLIRTGDFQSQTQGGAWQGGTGTGGSASLFVSAPGGGGSGNWWPGDLGSPNSTGGQNNVRYAYFAQSRRLAIELHGTVTVYDTGDHQIGGVSQQQSRGSSLTFTSQHGLVDVASLPVVSTNGAAPPRASSPAPASVPAQTGSRDQAPSGGDADIFGTVERLAELRGKGILSDNEFNAKKAELLKRL